MSFSSDVKAEISKIEVAGSPAKAMLCALFLSRASLNWNASGTWLAFQTENASIAKLVFRLLKNEYKVDIQLSSLRKMNLKKNNIYRLTVYERASEILEDLGILRSGGLYPVPPYPLIRSEKNARAFIQGLFLAAGSINHPKTANYHLEMNLPTIELANMTVKLMSRFYIPAKITTRKQGFVVYTKAGDKIADFLRLLGASQSLFDFEGQRIQRDFYNQLTRLDNCEVANEMKTQKAASEQLEWIAMIENSSIQVPEKLRRVMEARKQNPEASTLELCDVLEKTCGEKISKSGMKHRIAKLKELAGEQKENQAIRKDAKPTTAERFAAASKAAKRQSAKTDSDESRPNKAEETRP